MRDSPWYIVFLLAVIGGFCVYVFVTSEMRTLQVTGKYSEEGRSRFGIASERYVIETDQGSMRLLQFPLIGFTFNAEDVYRGMVKGSAIEARVGYWPPKIISSHAKPHIMAVY